MIFTISFGFFFRTILWTSSLGLLSILRSLRETLSDLRMTGTRTQLTLMPSLLSVSPDPAVYRLMDQREREREGEGEGGAREKREREREERERRESREGEGGENI